MLSTLKIIAENPNSDDISHLTALVDALRAKRHESATENVRMLTQLLQGNLEQACALRHYVLRLYARRRQSSLYTDIGILPNAGFFTELFQRIAYRILPPALDDTYLRDCLDLVLPEKDDYVWIDAAQKDEWLNLIETLANAAPSSENEAPISLSGESLENNDDSAPNAAALAVSNAIKAEASDARDRSKTKLELLEAIQTLSYRISAMGLEPSLIRLYPQIEDFESPFLMQNVELHLYLASYLRSLEETAADSPPQAPIEDTKHLQVMLDQCDDIVAKIRKNALKRGTSVSLTYLLVRLDQSIGRLRKLLVLIDISLDAETENEAAAHPKRLAALTLAQELIAAHNRKYVIRELFADNINLLARNVTENASRTGEHYIAETRSEYGAMFRSAAGAGFIIGFMAMFKILYSYLRAAPLVEAFLFSMNYSLGFMLIHVLHFTVATKQPAMTASRIAAGLHSKDGRNIDLDSLVDLMVKVFRTQFIAVAGNLLLAFPVAYLIGEGYLYFFGHNLVTPDKAQHLLHDLDPIRSLAFFHAAIAGVCLFLAGLISGYYDNRALYTNMAKRVERAAWLRSMLGAERLSRFGNYLERNLGGLMGNFYFGILLGTIGTIGFLIGLPIDIRHITFSSANFSFALIGLDNHIDLSTAVRSIIGVFGIGMINLWVSFSLALFVALRSRQVRFRQGLALSKAVWKRFLKRPIDFFVPPRSAKLANEDEQV
ncbi:site-specific recombinase [Glaciimonas soli]|uniref:Recombinase n=1 Tax=Glaciimonas soli TaxID=2590999 RepID=A0A843YPP9_9BURK|nr:site-specific recombinase [Glaciimonas soli]MQR01475.1 recombinase [Glaciimonas soli]